MFWMFSREPVIAKAKPALLSTPQSNLAEKRMKAIDWLGERYACHPTQQVKKKEVKRG